MASPSPGWQAPARAIHVGAGVLLSWARPHVVLGFRQACPTLTLAPGWAFSMLAPNPCAAQTLHALPLPPAQPNVKTLLPLLEPRRCLWSLFLEASSRVAIPAPPELVQGWQHRRLPQPASRPREAPSPSPCPLTQACEEEKGGRHREAWSLRQPGRPTGPHATRRGPSQALS